MFMTDSSVAGFVCGSRIAWPLRWIANPVVSHLGSSNLPCRAKSDFSQRNRRIHLQYSEHQLCGFEQP